MRLILSLLCLLALGLTACSSGDTPPPEPATVELGAPVLAPMPVDCEVNFCPEERNFLIVYGDKGLDENNLGRIFQMAARTHERQVRANVFPGIPHFRPTDRIVTAHAGTVTELRKLMSMGNIVYMAYFGHSLNEGAGALLLGQASAPDTNLTNSPGRNNTPLTALRVADLRSDAQIRLFGCRGAWGHWSIAEQMADYLRVPVYGYANDGGSIGTIDPRLGHGLRKATREDVAAFIPADARDVWLVPSDGTPRFREFTYEIAHAGLARAYEEQARKKETADDLHGRDVIDRPDLTDGMGRLVSEPHETADLHPRHSGHPAVREPKPAPVAVRRPASGDRTRGVHVRDLPREGRAQRDRAVARSDEQLAPQRAGRNRTNP